MVYVGNDTSYICEGVVSEEALLRQPDLVVPVAFILQSAGVDHPIYELSQHSEIAILHTCPISSRGQVKEQASRKKKEILSAVVLGQKIIEIERQNHLYTSVGQSEPFL